MSKVAKIIFRSKEINEKAFMDVFYIVQNLYLNGQILKDFIVEEEETRFKATVVLTKDDALEEEYWPEDIKEFKDKFTLDIIIGSNELWYWKDNCCCVEPSFYIFDPFDHTVSPIKCGDCLEDVSLVQLPALNCEDRCEIVNFQELYCSIINLGEYDSDYSKSQLNNPNSQITNLGIKICEKIKSKTNIPTYYFLLTDENVKVCPKCGGVLETIPIDITKYSSCSNIDKVCKKCNLVFKTDKDEKDGE